MSKNILLVEDDQYIRELIEEFLVDEGMKVHGAENGQVALDYLREQSDLPELILLDLMMPVKDGAAFRQEQLADPRLACIPTVIMTADGNAETRRTELKAHAFIRKPLDIEGLLALVTENDYP